MVDWNKLKDSALKGAIDASKAAIKVSHEALQKINQEQAQTNGPVAAAPNPKRAEPSAPSSTAAEAPATPMSGDETSMESPHKRQKPRKTTTSHGTITVAGSKLPFTTVDISVGGASVHLNENISIHAGDMADFVWDEMKVCGHVELCWTKPATEGGTILGVKFLDLKGESNIFPGI